MPTSAAHGLVSSSGTAPSRVQRSSTPRRTSEPLYMQHTASSRHRIPLDPVVAEITGMDADGGVAPSKRTRATTPGVYRAQSPLFRRTNSTEGGLQRASRGAPERRDADGEDGSHAVRRASNTFLVQPGRRKTGGTGTGVAGSGARHESPSRLSPRARGERNGRDTAHDYSIEDSPNASTSPSPKLPVSSPLKQRPESAKTGTAGRSKKSKSKEPTEDEPGQSEQLPRESAITPPTLLFSKAPLSRSAKADAGAHGGTETYSPRAHLRDRDGDGTLASPRADRQVGHSGSERPGESTAPRASAPAAFVLRRPLALPDLQADDTAKATLPPRGGEAGGQPPNAGRAADSDREQPVTPAKETADGENERGSKTPTRPVLSTTASSASSPRATAPSPERPDTSQGESSGTVVSRVAPHSEGAKPTTVVQKNPPSAPHLRTRRRSVGGDTVTGQHPFSLPSASTDGESSGSAAHSRRVTPEPSTTPRNAAGESETERSGYESAVSFSSAMASTANEEASVVHSKALHSGVVPVSTQRTEAQRSASHLSHASSGRERTGQDECSPKVTGCGADKTVHAGEGRQVLPSPDLLPVGTPCASGGNVSHDSSFIDVDDNEEFSDLLEATTRFGGPTDSTGHSPITPRLRLLIQTEQRKEREKRRRKINPHARKLRGSTELMLRNHSVSRSGSPASKSGGSTPPEKQDSAFTSRTAGSTARDENARSILGSASASVARSERSREDSYRSNRRLRQDPDAADWITTEEKILVAEPGGTHSMADTMAVTDMSLPSLLTMTKAATLQEVAEVPGQPDAPKTPRAHAAGPQAGVTAPPRRSRGESEKPTAKDASVVTASVADDANGSKMAVAETLATADSAASTRPKKKKAPKEAKPEVEDAALPTFSPATSATIEPKTEKRRPRKSLQSMSTSTSVAAATSVSDDTIGQKKKSFKSTASLADSSGASKGAPSTTTAASSLSTSTTLGGSASSLRAAAAAAAAARKGSLTSQSTTGSRTGKSLSPSPTASPITVTTPRGTVRRKQIGLPGAAGGTRSTSGAESPSTSTALQAQTHARQVLIPLLLDAHERERTVTVVFDLDETLCNNHMMGPALLRPGALHILRYLRALYPSPNYKAPQKQTAVESLSERLYGDAFKYSGVARPPTPTPAAAVVDPDAAAKGMVKTVASPESDGLRLELILWTASVEMYARPVVARLDPHAVIFDQYIYRDIRWYGGMEYTKDLTRLGRSMERSVIVENAPASVFMNRHNAILVNDFVSSRQDRQLYVVKALLTEWLEKVERVVAPPKENDFLSARSIGSGGPESGGRPTGGSVATGTDEAAATETGDAEEERTPVPEGSDGSSDPSCTLNPTEANDAGVISEPSTGAVVAEGDQQTQEDQTGAREAPAEVAARQTTPDAAAGDAPSSSGLATQSVTPAVTPRAQNGAGRTVDRIGPIAAMVAAATSVTQQQEAVITTFLSRHPYMSPGTNYIRLTAVSQVMRALRAQGHRRPSGEEDAEDDIRETENEVRKTAAAKTPKYATSTKASRLRVKQSKTASTPRTEEATQQLTPDPQPNDLAPASTGVVPQKPMQIPTVGLERDQSRDVSPSPASDSAAGATAHGTPRTESSAAAARESSVGSTSGASTAEGAPAHSSSATSSSTVRRVARSCTTERASSSLRPRTRSVSRDE